MRRTSAGRWLLSVDNDKGIALIHIMMVLLFIGTIIGAAALLTGPLAKRSKTVDTRNLVGSAVQSITGYAATNQRLPLTTEYAGLMPQANDAWGNPLYYVTDSNLTTIPSGENDAICRRRTTALTLRKCRDAGCVAYADVQNVAFLILSPGANFNNQTAATQAVAAAATINIYEVDLVVDNYGGDLGGARMEPYDDAFAWVTLEELKNRIGCYSSARGRLKILNNELPAACIGQLYNATLYSDGGVAPSSIWTYSALPAGLTMNTTSGAISGTTSAMAGSYPVTFTRTDSDGNTVQKLLQLSVKSCP